jgi:beta-1,2-mannobiose phosphorylase / 1,2-beta-oligomannan phosphorylase
MSLANFDYIGGYTNNPIISKGTGAEWDSGGIREPGNPFWDSSLNKYIFSYSGYSGAYAGNNVYVGIATSPDGITWTKLTHLTDPTEDPYILENGGTYYLYCENKTTGTSIALYTSTDLITWAGQGDVLEKGVGTWDSQDVSSPIVWIEGTTWYMLFEGRGDTQGEIGLATSADGLNWNKSASNPVLSGELSYLGVYGSSTNKISWCSHLVSDSLNKVNGVYYFTFHAYTPSRIWFSGIATSSNLTTWTDAIGKKIKKQMGDTGDIMIYPEKDGDYLAVYAYGSADGFARGYLLNSPVTAAQEKIRGLSHG